MTFRFSVENRAILVFVGCDLFIHRNNMSEKNISAILLRPAIAYSRLAHGMLDAAYYYYFYYYCYYYC